VVVFAKMSPLPGCAPGALGGGVYKIRPPIEKILRKPMLGDDVANEIKTCLCADINTEVTMEATAFNTGTGTVLSHNFSYEQFLKELFVRGQNIHEAKSAFHRLNEN